MRPPLLFFRLFIWFSLRYMWTHRVRALIVVLGIALGAAVFTSVRLSVHAAIDSFSKSMDLIAGRSDAVLLRPGGRIPEELAALLFKHPAVQSVSAVMSAYVQPDDETAEPFLLIGIDPLLDRSFRDWDIRETRNPESSTWLQLVADPGVILVSAYLSDRYGWQPADEISLVHVQKKAAFTILGVLDTEGLALAEGGRVAITDIASFQEFTGIYGQVDRIELMFPADRPPLSLEQIGRELESVLPRDILIESPSDAKETGQAMIRSYQLNLSILSFASLFVGMFLVYSLVALNAATRRHELAVLRASGASPLLLFRLFITEGALLGLLGWLFAFPLSGLLVRYLLQGVSRTISTLFVRVHVDSLALDPWEMMLSFAATVAIAMLAAAQPSREAMKVSAGEALSKLFRPAIHRRAARRLGCLGAVLIVSVWPLSLLPGYSRVPYAGYLAMLFLFTGFALLCPWGLRKIGRIVSPLLGRLIGISAYLAGRYVRDSGTRTAVSVGALITAVALYAALVIMIDSFRGTVQLWVNQTVAGDLFVSGKMAPINRFRDPMPEGVVEGLKRLDTPVDIVQSRRFSLKYGSFMYELDVMNMETFLQHGSFVMLTREVDDLERRLREGEGVLVSEVFSNHTGLRTGDLFTARVESVDIELPILGVLRDYRTNGGVVFYDHDSFRRRYFNPGWSGVRLFFRKVPEDRNAAYAKLRRDVLEKCGSHLEMIEGREFRAEVLKIFDETFAVTTVLLLIAIIIAALGITTTLAVQVLERSKQLNTLFAVGAGRGQIRSMVFWEAVLLVLAGEFAGLICGLFLSYILIYVVNVQSFGWSFLIRIDWIALAGSLPLILFTALLAAIPAVRLIFRQPPATLLRE